MLFESILKQDFFLSKWRKNVIKSKIAYFVEEFYSLHSSSGVIQHGRLNVTYFRLQSLTIDALSRYKYISMVATDRANAYTARILGILCYMLLIHWCSVTQYKLNINGKLMQSDEIVTILFVT